MSTGTRLRGMLGTVAVISVVAVAGGLWTSFVSQSREIGDQEYDREKQVIVRWEVEMTRPANVVVLTQSSIRGSNKTTETSASNTLSESIPLLKSEKFSITVSGELPVSDRRGQVSCRIYVDSRRVAHKTRVVRAGENADGVTCTATAVG